MRVPTSINGPSGCSAAPRSIEGPSPHPFPPRIKGKWPMDLRRKLNRTLEVTDVVERSIDDGFDTVARVVGAAIVIAAFIIAAAIVVSVNAD